MPWETTGIRGKTITESTWACGPDPVPKGALASARADAAQVGALANAWAYYRAPGSGREAASSNAPCVHSHTNQKAP